MLFNSYEFLFVFLPLALICHFAAARKSPTAAAIVTTISSLLFYAWWRPPFVLLPALSIVVNFIIARAMLDSEAARVRLLLWFGITVNLLVLGYFKYYDLLLSAFEQRNPVPPDVPLALSFTTFVQIAFLVEIARRPHKVAPIQYAMFVSFFPHLIAGPIVRWAELGPQILDKVRYRVDWNNIALGLTILCIGLAKKILLADTLSQYIAPVFDASANGIAVAPLAAWGASVAFALQLYFDFSGYSDIAVGLGLLFNLRLPLNFAAPLRSTSIIDLWRRWHMSLSRFLADFVYVPLGGNRKGSARRIVNLMVTLTLGGLWHGANWTFIVWGALQGVLVSINHLWRAWRGGPATSRLGQAVSWFATFMAFSVGIMIFRSPNIQTAGRMLAAMVGVGGAPASPPIIVRWDFWGIEKGYFSEAFVRAWFGSYWSALGTLVTLGVLAIAMLVPDTAELVDYREGDFQPQWRRDVGWLKWQPSPSWAVVMLALFALVFINIVSFSEFLYFQF
jgi:alginate O-acetyltransferase complex protein AlgI